MSSGDISLTLNKVLYFQFIEKKILITIVFLIFINMATLNDKTNTLKRSHYLEFNDDCFQKNCKNSPI